MNLDELKTTAPVATADALLKRATELHEKGFMPWAAAEELALSEIGIEEAAIDELIGECTQRAFDDDFFLTGVDEVRAFMRAALVHQGMLYAISFAPAAPGVNESFEDRMSDWAHGDALDAERYRWLFGARTAEELQALTADSGPPPDKPQDYVLCELMANYVTKAYADAMIDSARADQSAAAKESP